MSSTRLMAIVALSLSAGACKAKEPDFTFTPPALAQIHDSLEEATLRMQELKLDDKSVAVLERRFKDVKQIRVDSPEGRRMSISELQDRSQRYLEFQDLFGRTKTTVTKALSDELVSCYADLVGRVREGMQTPSSSSQPDWVLPRRWEPVKAMGGTQALDEIDDLFRALKNPNSLSPANVPDFVKSINSQVDRYVEKIRELERAIDKANTGPLPPPEPTAKGA